MKKHPGWCPAWCEGRIVNRRETDQYDVFIGHGSKWGNPFNVEDSDACEPSRFTRPTSGDGPTLSPPCRNWPARYSAATATPCPATEKSS